MRKIQRPGKQRRKTEAEWNWRKNYRVWDANRKIFLYPENWIEPKLRLPARFRVSLNDVAVYIRPRCRAKGFRILLAGKNRTRRLLAVQTLARDLEKDLYRIDLNGVVSDYIGETEKNLGRVFDLAKKNRVVLFFDEADALFGKRTDVKDSHASIEIKYLAAESREKWRPHNPRHRQSHQHRQSVDAKVSFGYPHPTATKTAAQGVFHLLGNRTS
jgi:SpoVK/Ycf46/Vps4 family AAA+-type ATPase